MFNINSDGSICLEPGEYQITRIPVQRYEFVEKTYCIDDKTTPANNATNYNSNRKSSEATEMLITIPAGDTAIVHYYDKVAYYDKFTQVDTEINKFHNS